jgi:hypothetical protein
MTLQMENPARGSGANRVPNIKAVGTALDVQNPTETLSESPAVHRIASRFRITIPHARVVCELAGIGRHA